jgi:uncharacterized membrane protein
VPSNHIQFSVDFTTNIAESNFRYTQVFALYYAHEFYGKSAESSNSGFVFSNNPLPDYWDFIRFAFVIGMRIQAPRVQVTSKKMRRVVIVQCIVSVILNTSILMLAIMIVARYR